MQYVTTTSSEHVLYITLSNAKKRNALGLEMFDALDLALLEITEDTQCVLLLGEGAAFCSGFDMKACAENLSILETYILRLSALIRSLRRLPVPVVAGAHGAAIAGGCALLTGCDFVVGETDGKYGYPVHLIGISPAVTIPTLFQKLGKGASRSLVMSGELLSGSKAHSTGLLSHLVTDAAEVRSAATVLAHTLASKPPRAIQATKLWLNELDGSDNDALFDAPAVQSASSISEETIERLRKIWNKNDG